MKDTNTESSRFSPSDQTAAHRYQIYRQARNGVHYSHGPALDSQEEAVAHFLHSAPAFEGGGIRLWDQRKERVAASAEWNVEVTGFGFPVRTRANVFYDPSLQILAHFITEREAMEETVRSEIRVTV